MLYFSLLPVRRGDGASEGKVDALLHADGVVLQDGVQRLSFIHAPEADLFVIMTPKVSVVNSEIFANTTSFWCSNVFRTF